MERPVSFNTSRKTNGCGAAPYLTGNVLPLLNEIRHALELLLATGETTAIDLRGIPMAPGEEDYLLMQLGSGEVRAVIDALGPSEILETRYPGVWLVTHYNAEEDIVARFIEITEIPDLLKSQQDDIRDAMTTLDDLLKDERFRQEIQQHET